VSKIAVRAPIVQRKSFRKLKQPESVRSLAAFAHYARGNSMIGENNTAHKPLLTLRDRPHTHIG
jgi:hypothetical protein